MRLGCSLFIIVLILLCTACGVVSTIPKETQKPPVTQSVISPTPNGGILGSGEKSAKTDAQSAFNMLAAELISDGETIECDSLFIVRYGKCYEYTYKDSEMVMTAVYDEMPNAKSLSKSKGIDYIEYELSGIPEHIKIFVKK